MGVIQIQTLFLLLGLLAKLSSGQVECPPDGIAYFPHEDCSKYYLCASGESFLFDCPSGLYYNPRNHECDLEINVPECVDGTRPPETTTSISPITETTTLGPTPTTTPGTTSTGNTEPPTTVLRECGETLVANSGLIEYKLGETYASKLRCAFIIRSLNHTGFLFSLDEHGMIQDPSIPGGAINIFSFSNGGLRDISNLGPPNPLNQTYVSGSVVVVVFRTQGFQGRGFSLSFTATGEPNYDFVTWEDTIIADLPTTFHYPSEGQYAWNTLSFFVLSNLHQEIPSTTQALRLSVSELDIEVCSEGCSCDFLNVYSFAGSNLDTLDKLCGSGDDVFEYESGGLFIVMFKTDHTNNGRGFQLTAEVINK